MTNNLDPKKVIAQAGPWNNKPKMKSLEIFGRRWFQRGPGNTYHTVQVVIDGKTVWKSVRTYGYDDAYEQTAAAWLKEQGFIDRDDCPLWRYCLDHGIKYQKYATDVQRRKDL